MKRRHLFNIMLLAVLCTLSLACHRRVHSNVRDTDTVKAEIEVIEKSAMEKVQEGVKVAPEMASAEEEDIKRRIKSVYEHVGRAYEKSYGADEDLDELYCSSDWNKTVSMVKAKDGKSSSEGPGFFEADYWVMGQDAMNVRATDIVVDTLQMEESCASVSLKLHNCGNITPVRLVLVYEDNKWLIDDFISLDEPPLDWKQAMKDYLKE